MVGGARSRLCPLGSLDNWPGFSAARVRGGGGAAKGPPALGELHGAERGSSNLSVVPRELLPQTPTLLDPGRSQPDERPHAEERPHKTVEWSSLPRVGTSSSGGAGSDSSSCQLDLSSRAPKEDVLAKKLSGAEPLGMEGGVGPWPLPVFVPSGSPTAVTSAQHELALQSPVSSHLSGPTGLWLV